MATPVTLTPAAPVTLIRTDTLAKMKADNAELLSALKLLVEDLELRSTFNPGSKNGVVDCGHGVYERAKRAIMSRNEPATADQALVAQAIEDCGFYIAAHNPHTTRLEVEALCETLLSNERRRIADMILGGSNK